MSQVSRAPTTGLSAPGVNRVPVTMLGTGLHEIRGEYKYRNIQGFELDGL